MIEQIAALLESWGLRQALDQVRFLADPGNLLFAVWVSPVKCSPWVFARKRIGMIPVPVPRSSAFSPLFTFANPESKTASIP